MSDDFYSPDRIDWCLRQWDLVCSLAETPATSRHHLDSDHRKHGPCLDSVRSGSGGRIPDTLSWADVRADIHRAYAQLAIGSHERRIVYERIHRGGNINMIAKRIGARSQIIRDAYHSAVARMSGYLGYVAPADDLEAVRDVLRGYGAAIARAGVEYTEKDHQKMTCTI